MLRGVSQATALLLVALSVAGCGNSDADYDRGHDDGFAVGYNTACEIRRTLISGDFDNEHYSRGYADGMAEGAGACRRDQRSGRVN